MLTTKYNKLWAVFATLFLNSFSILDFNTRSRI